MIRATSASALVSPPLPPHLSPSSSSSTKQLNKATCNQNFHDVAVVVDEKENLNSTQQRKQQQHNFLQQLYLHHQKIKQQHEQHKRAVSKLEQANRVKYGELIVLGECEDFFFLKIIKRNKWSAIKTHNGMVTPTKFRLNM